MTKLSPAAQAILDAASDVYWDWGGIPSDAHVIAAAALRAAVDQVVPESCFESDDVIRAELLAIAAELEGAQ